MKKFSKILVALDGSKESMQSADLAISIAILNDAELTALHVFYSLLGYAYTSYLSKLEESPSIDALLKAAEKKAGLWFSSIATKLAVDNGKRSCVRFNSRVVTTSTSVPAAITGYASKNEINLIVIGKHGRSGIKEKLLGSVAREVIRGSTCPVLVAK
ncbi:MAG TPA: universal stress protein [Nitrososphaeraceae archaeon]|nr:universal stress protein [Nitrososphaeraceae archaeon]